LDTAGRSNSGANGVQSFLDEVILPAEHTFHEQVHAQAATDA
jgi:hypothetical protein